VRSFEKMTKAEVISAQRAWAKAVVDQDVETLLGLYDFGSPDEPLLFKPTLADVIRLDEEGARSYFVGGNENYPHDGGFLNRGWKHVDFQSAVGPILKRVALATKTWVITPLSTRGAMQPEPTIPSRITSSMAKC
jgi:hypothetical protein